MNSIRNKVQLIGRLGQAPVIKQMESGKTMAKFSLATSESYKNSKGEKIEDTQWHNVVAWGNVAMIAEKYLEKGKEVALEGKLMHRSYEDKEGNTRYVTEVVVSEILMLGSKTAA